MWVAFIAICLSLSLQLASSGLSISPSEQAKWENGIATTNKVVDVLQSASEKYSKYLQKTQPLTKASAKFVSIMSSSIKVFGKYNILCLSRNGSRNVTWMFTKIGCLLIQIFFFPGALSKMLGPAGTIASVIFTFHADSGMDRLTNFVTKEFKKVNSKLDGIFDKFGILEENLKNYISANTDTNNLDLYAGKILNSKIKYTEMLDDLENLALDYNPKTSPLKKLKIRESFRDHYELSNVDNAIQNIIRLTNTEVSRPTLRKDLFSSVREVVHCDIEELSRLQAYVRKYM